MVLEITLVDELTGEAVNSATVDIRLTDIAGNDLAGETWPKAMGYVASSAGIYRTLLSGNIVMEEGASYLYEATSEISGVIGRWSGEVAATRRSF